jgi:RNA polymerase sigma-70 factor (ECF subfamily)
MPGSARERELVADFADAFENGDIDRVVEMLTDDAWVTMPPEPYEYQGRAAIAEFLWLASAAARAGRSIRLVPTRANGQPAFAHYIREPGAPAAQLSGLFVLSLSLRPPLSGEGGAVAVLTRFALSNVSPLFGFAPTI